MEYKSCIRCYNTFKGKNKTCENCILKIRLNKLKRDSKIEKQSLVQTDTDSNRSSEQSSSYSTCSDEEWLEGIEESVVVKKDETPNDIIKNLIEFENKKLIEKKQSINFAHPFTCKLLGCRGSGKTTFIINYLNAGVLNLYDDIIWISTSDQQELLTLLNDKNKVRFYEPKLEHIESIYNNLSQDVKTLLIFDDCMQEGSIRNNKTVLSLYTKGRHLNVSILSLEQHLHYSSNVERGNTDYFLIFKLNDMEGLERFRKKFCNEYNANDFGQIYNHCMNLNKPLFISFNSYAKFRSNFNTEIKLVHNMIEESPIIRNIIDDVDLKIIPKKKKTPLKIFKRTLVDILIFLF